MGAIKLALDLESGGRREIQDMTDEELKNYEAELILFLKGVLATKDTIDDNSDC